jgi:quercetin dioxygenase-like cupin family protein
MSPTHHVLRTDEGRYKTPEELAGHHEGWRRRTIIDAAAGAVHTGFNTTELDVGGHIGWHVHSYEESIFVLEGEAVCETEDGAYRLRPGDYGIIHVGAPHAWRNVSDVPVRWAEMLAPQPRPGASDTFAVPAPVAGEREPIGVDPRDPRTRYFGHIDPDNMDPDKQTQEMLAQSASMRTALLVYSGITVKMMVDSDLGAHLLTMFMVRYEPEGLAGAHDHPLEETYLILEGEVDASFDGEEYRLLPGDTAFAGVGCVHAFANAGDTTVRWLETQAPQPPSRHSYRFARDWDHLREALERTTTHDRGREHRG